MSMILDALQRADRERRKEEPPAPTLPPAAHSVPQAPPGAPRRAYQRSRYRWSVLLLLLLVIAGLTARWLQTEPQPSQPATVTSTELSASDPVEPSLPGQDNPEMELRQPGIERLYQAPSHLPADESVAALYRQPEEATPAADSADELTHRLPPSREGAGVRVQTAATDTPPASRTDEPEIEQPSVALPSVPAIRDLSWNLQQEIPSLNYQAHQYRREQGQASRVTINQRELGVGDQVAPDLRVERIDEDGVVLSYKGQSFKLQALNSWINM